MLRMLREFIRDPVCKECQKKKDGKNWRTFPHVSAHLVWRDEKKVWHYYPDYEKVTYCRKPMQ